MTARGRFAGLKVWIVVTAILVLGLPRAHAQDFSGIFNAVGSVFKSIGVVDLYAFAKNRDTTFYMSPPGDISVCVSMNLAGSRQSTWGSESSKNSKFRSHISSDNMVNSSITVGYKGIALGYTFNPFATKSASKDYRFTLTLHGNFLGLDFAYYKINSFSGYSKLGNERYNIPYGDPNMKLFLLNTYIVFNHRHYSYPAGVNLSYIQKRSSGSLIAGVTYSNNRTNVSSLGFEEPSLKINSKMISIGAGYGYNYVPSRNLLVSFMFMPKFVVYDSSYIDVDKYDIEQTFKRPELTYSGSIGIVKWMGHFYTGLTALADGYESHHTSTGFRLLQMQWHVHAHLGVNF